eukprot:scaffold152144_cov63-Attheya_sp.AAC.1
MNSREEAVNEERSHNGYALNHAVAVLWLGASHERVVVVREGSFPPWAAAAAAHRLMLYWDVGYFLLRSAWSRKKYLLLATLLDDCPFPEQDTLKDFSFPKLSPSLTFRLLWKDGNKKLPI